MLRVRHVIRHMPRGQPCKSIVLFSDKTIYLLDSTTPIQIQYTIKSWISDSTLRDAGMALRVAIHQSVYGGGPTSKTSPCALEASKSIAKSRMMGVTIVQLPIDILMMDF